MPNPFAGAQLPHHNKNLPIPATVLAGMVMPPLMRIQQSQSGNIPGYNDEKHCALRFDLNKNFLRDYNNICITHGCEQYGTGFLVNDNIYTLYNSNQSRNTILLVVRRNSHEGSSLIDALMKDPRMALYNVREPEPITGFPVMVSSTVSANISVMQMLVYIRR